MEQNFNSLFLTSDIEGRIEVKIKKSKKKLFDH